MFRKQNKKYEIIHIKMIENNYIVFIFSVILLVFIYLFVMLILLKNRFFILCIFDNKFEFMGIGDWGLGIGDWGLGPIPNPQSPIPNSQSP